MPGSLRCAGRKLDTSIIQSSALWANWGLGGHPDKRFLPVLEANTGSLGQGVSIGIGMALAANLDKKDYHTFVMAGDGEIQEGQNWEAAMFAPYHKLQNLAVMIDYNHQQLDGFTKDILDVSTLREHFEAVGWVGQPKPNAEVLVLAGLLPPARTVPLQSLSMKHTLVIQTDQFYCETHVDIRQNQGERYELRNASSNPSAAN